MRAAAVLFLSLLAAAASAQPVLPADSARALAGRAATAGLLSDSSAAALAACAEAGAPLTRSSFVEAVWADAARRLRGLGPGPIPNQMVGYSIDSTAGSPHVRWVDSLAAVGLLSPDDLRTVRPVVDAVLEEVPENLPPAASLVQFQLIGPLVAAREAVDPSWLAGEADWWVEQGLMDDAERARLLRAARAGRLGTVYDAVGYLDAVAQTEVVSERSVDWRAASADTLAHVVAVAADLLRQRGVADLRVEGLADDTVRRYRPAWVGDRDGWAWDTTRVLAARVDGVPYRQEVTYSQGPLALLNRVLRDRGAVHRLFWIPQPDLERRGLRLGVAVLTEAERRVLEPRRLSDLSPRRRALAEAGRSWDRWDADAPCGAAVGSALNALVGADVDVEGPERSGQESLLTTEAVRNALDRIEAAGLLAHLAADVRASVWAGLEERYLREPGEVLAAIPDLVVSFYGDDAAYGPDPYAEHVRLFAAASRGAFAPTDVVDTFDPRADSVDVAFTAGGRRYRTRLEVDGDWLFAGFLDAVVEATAEGGARLYRLGPYTEDGFIFLTPAQRRALQGTGLLPTETSLLEPGFFQ